MNKIVVHYTKLKKEELQKIIGGQVQQRLGTKKAVSKLWHEITSHLHIG